MTSLHLLQVSLTAPLGIIAVNTSPADLVGEVQRPKDRTERDRPSIPASSHDPPTAPIDLVPHPPAGHTPRVSRPDQARRPDRRACPLADAIAFVNPTRLATRVTSAALPVVGRFASLGRDLRSYLDSNLDELKTAIRAAEGATLEPEFATAMQQVDRLLPMAELQVERVDSLASEIMATLSRMYLATFLVRQAAAAK
jgi:hypothetical protein